MTWDEWKWIIGHLIYGVAMFLGGVWCVHHLGI
jgi:hypothetical protein